MYQVNVRATYTIPVIVDENMNRNEQIRQALRKGADIISKTAAVSLKLWMIEHCEVVLPKTPRFI